MLSWDLVLTFAGGCYLYNIKEDKIGEIRPDIWCYGVDTDEDYIYLCYDKSGNNRGTKLDVICKKTYKMVRRTTLVETSNVHALKVSSDKIFLCDTGNGRVCILEKDTLKVWLTISCKDNTTHLNSILLVGDREFWIGEHHFFGRGQLTVGEAGSKLTRLNFSNGVFEVKDEIMIGCGIHDIEEIDGSLYTCSSKDSCLKRFDLASREETSIVLPGGWPRGLSYDSASKEFYVGLSNYCFNRPERTTNKSTLLRIKGGEVEEVREFNFGDLHQVIRL